MSAATTDIHWLPGYGPASVLSLQFAGGKCVALVAESGEHFGIAELRARRLISLADAYILDQLAERVTRIGHVLAAGASK